MVPCVWIYALIYGIAIDKIKDDSGLEEMWNRFKRVNYFVDDLSWGEVSETIVDKIEKISFFSDQVS